MLSGMCGIVGYVGRQSALDIAVEALRRMEYRGYDSAGIAVLDGAGGVNVEKKAGKLANLENELDAGDRARFVGSTGIGHTRWATHDRPTRTRTRTSPTTARSPSSTTASSRTSPRCAPSWRTPASS